MFHQLPLLSCLPLQYVSKRWGQVWIQEYGTYADGSAAIKINDYIGNELLCILTVNVDAGPQVPGIYIVKTWSENTEIAKELLGLGIFTDTGERIPIGYVEAQIWRVAISKKE